MDEREEIQEQNATEFGEWFHMESNGMEEGEISNRVLTWKKKDRDTINGNREYQRRKGFIMKKMSSHLTR